MTFETDSTASLDSVTIADHNLFLGGFLTFSGGDLIKRQLQSLAPRDPASLIFGLIFGPALALFSAIRGSA